MRVEFTKREDLMDTAATPTSAAAGDATALPVQAVLALQQRAGNRAVSRMVREAATARQRLLQRGRRSDFERKIWVLDTARRRAPLPAGAGIAAPGSLAPPGRRPRIDKAGELILTDAAGELGTLSYYVGPLDDIYVTAAARARHPWVEALIEQQVPVVKIGGFDSWEEHRIKGIGSALLHRLLELADGHDCDYIFVLFGVNHEVYEALGFELIDPIAETWAIKRSALRARLPRASRWNGAPLPPSRVRESPL